jgi:hypothetical protein
MQSGGVALGTLVGVRVGARVGVRVGAEGDGRVEVAGGCLGWRVQAAARMSRRVVRMRMGGR